MRKRKLNRQNQHKNPCFNSDKLNEAGVLILLLRKDKDIMNKFEKWKLYKGEIFICQNV